VRKRLRLRFKIFSSDDMLASLDLILLLLKYGLQGKMLEEIHQTAYIKYERP
jgi:hypothetical protein